MRHMAKHKRPTNFTKRQASSSPYFMQPGKRGAIIVLHKPGGNRAVPKICGTMPSRAHAKMLINQLEKAESVVKDLFLEATDDGIEALEAVLVACCEEVLRKGPKVSDGVHGGHGGGGGGGHGGRSRGRRSGSRDASRDAAPPPQAPYDEAAS